MKRRKAGLASKIHSVDEVTAPAEIAGAPIRGPRGLGDSLKQARLARGLSIADVSASLRLRGAYLDAIENDRREALPGPVYANGYVRSYAAFLGMDPDEAVRRFKREAGDTRARPELVFPSPAPEGRVPGGAALLVGLVFLVTVYGGWYYLTSKDFLLSDLAPDVPARLAHLMEPAADKAAGSPQEASPPAAEAPRTSVTAVTSPAAAPPPAAPLNPPPVAAVPTAPVTPAAVATTAAATPEAEARAAPPSQVPSAPPLNGLAISAAQATPSAATMAVSTDVVDSSGPGRITLEALAPAWVRLRRPDGEVLLSKVMRRGEKFTVPDHPAVLLSTGDAASVAVFVDGARVADVGGAGQILEDVTLVADRLAAAGGAN